MISASVVRPDSAPLRPGLRFGLIDAALAPAGAALGRERLQQLKRDLAIVMSAEALFTLTDLCGLPAAEAIASAVHTARTLTAAAIAAGSRRPPPRQPVFCRPAATPLTVSSRNRSSAARSSGSWLALTSSSARNCRCESASTYGSRSATARDSTASGRPAAGRAR